MFEPVLQCVVNFCFRVIILIGLILQLFSLFFFFHIITILEIQFILEIIVLEFLRPCLVVSVHEPVKLFLFLLVRFYLT